MYEKRKFTKNGRYIQGVSKGGRERPSGARKILKKKFALPEEDIRTLILFNT
jgi:hypothetical protein